MMNKVELLAPAGSIEALYAAVQNGCDAVYLGGTLFGARAFAHNFDAEELEEAVAYAHLYHVSVYVTVNTLLYEEEMQEAIRYIQFLQQIDVDALIVQDVGLLSMIRSMFPDMEVHASTQMHVHNEEGIQFLKQLGAARVVVPRETTIEEIKKYAKLGIELEVFVQGALCVSYSGECLMSSVLFNRSGNRGACAQPCRMQYTLHKDLDGTSHKVKTVGDYLLSPKDLNTLDQIPALIQAGVSSFKIEGRMKRPEYVAYVVSLYRRAIDAYQHHEAFTVDTNMLENMEKLFHRGFTQGHLFHQMGSALMNPLRPNHMGVRIGKVVELQKDKMLVKLEKELVQGDGLRLLGERDEGFCANRIYVNGLLVNHGEAGQIIAFDRIMGVKKGAEVLKTSDVKQLEALQKTYQSYQRRIVIDASFLMLQGQAPILTVWDKEGHEVSMKGNVLVEKAQKTSLDAKRIEKQLKKTGSTPFDIQQITYTIDENVTFPISELNRMRREALDQMCILRSMRHAQRRILPTPEYTEHAKQPSGVHIIVHTYEQYEACKAYPVKIYAEGLTLYQRIAAEDTTIKLRTPRVRKAKGNELPGITQDLGGCLQPHQIYDTSLNVTNSRAGDLLFQQDADIVIFSWEMSSEECKKIAQKHTGYGFMAYGKRELMISEYCVINAMEKDNDKHACGLCKKAKYHLVDMKQRAFPLLCDEHCRMHILEEKPLDRIHEIEDLSKAGIQQFFATFTNETKEECQEVLQRLNEVRVHDYTAAAGSKNT